MSAITTDPRQIPSAAHAHARGRGMPRVLRGRDTDPPWARPALLGLLALTALLYMVGLSRSGWANDFYSGAVPYLCAGPITGTTIGSETKSPGGANGPSIPSGRHGSCGSQHGGSNESYQKSATRNSDGRSCGTIE